MASTLAMSTAWNAKRHERAKDIVHEILGLGIDKLEAGYLLNEQQLRELADLLDQGGFEVVSIHNFCPIPAQHSCAWGDDALLSSPDEEKRKEGIAATLTTLAWAERLGARVVVMHLGEITMDKASYQAAKQMVADEHRHSVALRRAVAATKREREARAAPHLAAIRRSLEAICARLPKGVVLGLENRYDYVSIPNLHEMQHLLAEYGAAVGYWHDVGHAHMQEFMGFYERGAYMRTLGERLVGAHIHDAAGASDHRPPGQGEIDFASLVQPLMADAVLRVLEFHPRVTRDEAAAGIEFLHARGIL